MNWSTNPAPGSVPELVPPPLPPAGPEGPGDHAPAHQNPTLIETIAFFALAAILLIVIQGLSAAEALHWGIYGKTTLKGLAYNPRFAMPVMGISYGAILLASAALFGRAWRGSFLRGIHWNWAGLRRSVRWLPWLGIGLGIAIQLVSNVLPIPKQLPVDAFFRNAIDAWIVALFGVFIAPIMEEIAFRGFLYPALRRWTGGILAAILTSIPFAWLHAQQVGHAWAPLAMVFLVSLVLAAVRDRTDSVAASAMVHAFYNLSIFAVIFAATGGFHHLERLKG
jgi:membrane protease YdiL (CAAX protease family)